MGFRIFRDRLGWLAMLCALGASAIAALCVGRYPLHPSSVLEQLGHLLANRSGLTNPEVAIDMAERLVLHIRLPRVLASMLVGASLATCGATLQGAFKNPLVEPHILGISSGAALGGCAGIFFFSSMTAILGMAFGGGLFAIACVYVVARISGKGHLLVLVLAGIVTGAFFGSLLSLLTYFADPNDTLPAIVFWLMGSFATASYGKVGVMAVPALAGMAVLYLMRFRINVLSMGDEHAASLGIAVEKVRWALLTCVALIVSASVAVSGSIGWVGLVIPHVARMIVGPDHRVLLPASAVLGATFLLWVDTAARSVTAAELPLAVLTSLIGAPVFALILRKASSKGWSDD